MTRRFTLLIFFIGLFSQTILAQDGETIYKDRKPEQKIENFLEAEMANGGFIVDVISVEIRDYLNVDGEKVECMDIIIVHGIINNVTLDEEKNSFFGDDDPTLLHDVVFKMGFVIYRGGVNWGEIIGSMEVLKVLKSRKNTDGRIRIVDSLRVKDNKKHKIGKWYD